MRSKNYFDNIIQEFYFVSKALHILDSTLQSATVWRLILRFHRIFIGLDQKLFFPVSFFLLPISKNDLILFAT